MQLQIKKATRLSKKIKLAIIGIAGSGKTYSALAIAKGLGQKILVIDTEHGSAAAYAVEFDFDTIELETFSPQTYVSAIKLAEENGYDVLIIDSLSHAWSGKDGALEMVDKAGRRAQSGNSFAAWRDVTPAHNEMVEAIVGAKCHVIATLRAKTEYVVEQGKNGKSAPRKVGLAPVQRDGMEYEFDVVGTLDQEHFLTITKSRISALADQVIDRPGDDVAQTLSDWINSGAPVPPPTKTREELYSDLSNLVDELGYYESDLTFYEQFNARQKPEVLQKAIDRAESALATAIDAAKKTPRNLAVNERPTLNTEVTKKRTRPVDPDAQKEVDEIFADPESDTTPPPVATPNLITEAQQRAVMAIAGRVFGRHERDAELTKMLGNKQLENLAKSEAHELIETLKAMLGEADPSTVQRLASEPMTPGQRKLIFKAAGEIWDKDESEAKLHELVSEMYQKDSLTLLLKSEATGLIDRLNNLAFEKEEADGTNDPFAGSDEPENSGATA